MALPVNILGLMLQGLSVASAASDLIRRYQMWKKAVAATYNMTEDELDAALVAEDQTTEDLLKVVKVIKVPDPPPTFPGP